MASLPGNWERMATPSIAVIALPRKADGCRTRWPIANTRAEAKATHIPRITAKELVDRNLNDLVVERVVVDYLPRARWCKELQIVNGLKPGQVLAALEGKDVGTIISA